MILIISTCCFIFRIKKLMLFYYMLSNKLLYVSFTLVKIIKRDIYIYIVWRFTERRWINYTTLFQHTLFTYICIQYHLCYVSWLHVARTIYYIKLSSFISAILKQTNKAKQSVWCTFASANFRYSTYTRPFIIDDTAR